MQPSIGFILSLKFLSAGVGAVSTANPLGVTVGAGLTITGITETCTGPVAVTNTGNIVIAGNIAAGTDNVTLTSTAGSISEMGAAFITVDETALRSAETAEGYAREMDEDFQRRQRAKITEVLRRTDVVICTALIPGRKAPLLLTETMDIIKLYGSEPANFLDVGGGASKEKVTAAFKIIVSDPHVKGILVNIFGGIMKCDIIAEGIIAAAKEVSLKVPLVVRLEGTNVELGKKILAESGLPIVSANDLADAAQKIVKAVKG